MTQSVKSNYTRDNNIHGNSNYLSPFDFMRYALRKMAENGDSNDAQTLADALHQLDIVARRVDMAFDSGTGAFTTDVTSAIEKIFFLFQEDLEEVCEKFRRINLLDGSEEELLRKAVWSSYSSNVINRERTYNLGTNIFDVGVFDYIYIPTMKFLSGRTHLDLTQCSKFIKTYLHILHICDDFVDFQEDVENGLHTPFVNYLAANNSGEKAKRQLASRAMGVQLRVWQNTVNNISLSGEAGGAVSLLSASLAELNEEIHSDAWICREWYQYRNRMPVILCYAG